MYQRRALVVGATGIVGLNVAEHLRDRGGWEIHGLSRRPPPGASYMKSHKVDLLDREGALATLADLAPTTSITAPGRSARTRMRTSGSTAVC